ncbi:Cytidylate kinase [Symmachiella macrocystis]|uniref:Cytidylate kinase n=1 Tax=Symmachiella macrocystis TaxID=2527985 RepID=A0A5C6BAD7_9PLAN|nr:(d)CMP kinase [Symmachiella macrocystis]TWU08677.1 Cytidylate kinase [Symmachiella macrocystis]
MIITIDGPAGAGKSTVARQLANRLGFAFLDTGAMYRAVAWACLQRDVDFSDVDAVADVARTIVIQFDGDEVLVDGQNVSGEIRTNDVTAASQYTAGNIEVREILVEQQRRIAGDADVVTEGRDQGTVVFPAAEFKFFITASPESRARRRQEEFAARGQNIPLEQVLADQTDRDNRDAARKVGAMKPAADAIEVDTSDIDADAVVQRLLDIIRGSAG